MKSGEVMKFGGQPEEKYASVTGVEKEDQIQMALALEVKNVKCVRMCTCFRKSCK